MDKEQNLFFDALLSAFAERKKASDEEVINEKQDNPSGLPSSVVLPTQINQGELNADTSTELLESRPSSTRKQKGV